VPWPKDESTIGEALIRSLLEDQHADLANLPLARVGLGFDNEVWRLGDEFVLRLSRHAIGANLLSNELRWQPEVTKKVNLRVPKIVRRGEPSEDFPWPWAVLTWLEGTTADGGVLRSGPDAVRIMVAFLRAVHQAAPKSAPHNEWRGVPLEQRSNIIDERLATLGESVNHVAIRSLWERAVFAPLWTSPNVWLHGDLHPGNILLEDGLPTGVLDFGDLCQGDPATDLGAVLMLLPGPTWGMLFDSYGSSDPAMTLRAVGWAVLFGVFFTELGLSGRATYEAIGRATIKNALDFEASNL